ncbi:MAG: hypothetical protein ACI392_06530 [Paludibacteraceae bacterium]
MKTNDTNDTRDLFIIMFILSVSALLYAINCYVEYDKFNIAAIAVAILCSAFVIYRVKSYIN